MLKDDYKIYEEKMNKSIDSAAADFASVRAGRANAAVLDRIMVDYYGTPTPISQMASVAVPDSRTITIQPWDKGGISVVEKAILKSDLGLTPVNDGRIIRINIPPLTEERRKELVKQIKSEAETARISIRNIRRDAVEAFKKAQKEGMPEDMAKDGEDSSQKLTDKYMKKVDELFAAKEAEIMTV